MLDILSESYERKHTQMNPMVNLKTVFHRSIKNVK